eukprot:5372681-Amphidinium_carterae.1
MHKAGLKANSTCPSVVAAAIRKGPLAAILEEFLAKSASILQKGPLLQKHMAALQGLSVEAASVKVVLEVANDMPGLKQCLMSNATEALETLFVQRVLELKDHSMAWSIDELSLLMQLFSAASTVVVENCITLGMYELGQRLQESEGKRIVDMLLGLAGQVVDHNIETLTDDAVGGIIEKAIGFKAKLTSHSLSLEQFGNHIFVKALEKLATLVAKLFQAGDKEEKLKTLLEVTLVLAKCLQNPDKTCELELVQKSVELQSSSQALARSTSSAIKNGTPMADLLQGCITCKRHQQQVNMMKDKAKSATQELLQAIDQQIQDSEKIYYTAHGKVVEATEKVVSVAEQNLAAIAFGLPSGEQWLAKYTGESFTDLLNHAQQTILALGAENLVPRIAACAEATLYKPNCSPPNTENKGLIPMSGLSGIQISFLVTLNGCTQHCTAPPPFLSNPLDSISREAIQKYESVMDALGAQKDKLLTSKVMGLLAQARQTKCAAVVLTAFVAHDANPNPEHLRSVVQLQLKELRANSVPEEGINPLLKDKMYLAMALSAQQKNSNTREGQRSSMRASPSLVGFVPAYVAANRDASWELSVCMVASSLCDK